jgi:hypothetical protein
MSIKLIETNLAQKLARKQQAVAIPLADHVPTV